MARKMSKKTRETLRSELFWTKRYSDHDEWRLALRAAEKVTAIIEVECGKEDDDRRREITGRSGVSSKGSHGNTGFAGGCTLAAA